MKSTVPNPSQSYSTYQPQVPTAAVCAVTRTSSSSKYLLLYDPVYLQSPAVPDISKAVADIDDLKSVGYSGLML